MNHGGIVEVSDPRLVQANSTSCSPLLSQIPHSTPFQNKTSSPFNHKTRTAIFAYFRKRSVTPPKIRNICQLTKTHDFPLLPYNIRISPKPEFEFPEETFLPEKSGIFLFGINSQILCALQIGCADTSGIMTRFLAFYRT